MLLFHLSLPEYAVDVDTLGILRFLEAIKINGSKRRLDFIRLQHHLIASIPVLIENA